ncbi:hypothetical protein [Priestia megaterium]|nr:hypothetical protein [Priestia megaterium]MED4278658.1 hypothetical protein [Priestia megaterium]MED4287172.1 hypothetical protein [Priestia megaterium]MED4298899.1 hypothetical protein [Priestia megaterium]MED4319516.1 hypothetical protein [Priestia megaterium]
MTIHTEVFYMDKRFKIIHIYDSGYCEIRKISNSFEVELALLTDLIAIR